MTEKRFVLQDLDILCRVLDNGKPINGIETVHLLNKFDNENEQLKKALREQLDNINKEYRKENLEIKEECIRLRKENEQLKKENKQLKSEIRYIQSELHNNTMEVRERTLAEVKESIRKLERWE